MREVRSSNFVLRLGQGLLLRSWPSAMSAGLVWRVFCIDVTPLA